MSPSDPWLSPAGLPATLLIEALCQAAACLNGLSTSDPQGHRGVLAGLSDFQFYREEGDLRSGDRLRLEVQRERALGALQSFSGQLLRDHRPLCAGRLLFAVSFW